MFRKYLLILLATLMASACSQTQAGPLVDVAVVDRDSGRWLPTYRYQRESWIAGIPGSRYGVRLTNATGERVLVVLSVDGVNAVSGQTANPSQAGYVLGPWESAEISGWRKSLEDVAQFVFTDLGDSYAARTGRPRNVGVIGVAVFQESRPRYTPMPVAPTAQGRGYDERAESKAADPGASAARESVADSTVQQRMGTGHGQREWSPVSQTSFIRATRSPAQISELRYEDERRLIALGIIPRATPYYLRGGTRPSAFPDGYVADPPPR